MAEPALQVCELQVRYGAIHAVQHVSLEVAEGGLVALVGSNGAGKSSVLNAVAGVVAASSGTVTVHGCDVSACDTKTRVLEHGVVLVPEGRSVFGTLTVAENLDLGGRIGRARHTRGVAARFTTEEVFDLFPALAQRLRDRAQVLSGGEQQMLALARSLLMAPSVLLIDEPSMGLAPLLVRTIFDVLRTFFTVHRITVLLVEQDTALALDLAGDAYLLEQGRIVAHAPAAELRRDPRLRESYLGSHDALGTAVLHGEEGQP